MALTISTIKPTEDDDLKARFSTVQCCHILSRNELK